MSISIYMAGKIERGRTRFGLVDCAIPEHDKELVFAVDIPPRPFVFDGKKFQYSGPFTVSNDHGTTHSFSHASFSGAINGFPMPSDLPGGSPSEKYSRLILDRSLNGINKADLIYAWVDSEDAFGTLSETSYALGLEKTVYIATGPNINGETQAWFPLLMGRARFARTPKDGLKAALREMEYCS